MKTLTKFTTTLATIFVLSGCASTTGGTIAIDPNAAIGTASNVGMAVFQTAVDQKCRSEITNNQYYKLASVAMTADQQAQIQNNVCGCVSQKAMQNVNIVDLATAAANPSSRTQIVGTAVTNTLQSCVSEFIR